MDKEKKLRWGIMSTASIARSSVIPGLQQSQFNEVKALASRDAVRARQTADEFGIETAHDSYEAMIQDDSIDAVYIPLPNHLHKQWAIAALRAGKHVLCEKPIALTAAEAQEMAAAAAESGRILAEAFMYRHHPRYDLIRGIIDSGEIGAIRGIHSTFTFNSSSSREGFRFRTESGGGGLYDIGCYPITAARLLLGEEPQAATVHAFFSPDHGNVDMMASGLLEFSGGVALTFDCGMWGAFRNTLEVLGTDGVIEVPSAFIANPDSGANFFVSSGSGRREVEVPKVNHFALECDDFARTALFGEPQRFTPQDAVRNMAVLDACLLSARQRTRVELQQAAATI